MGSVSSSGCGVSLAQGTVAAGVLSMVRSIALLAIGSIYLQLSSDQEPEEILDYAADDVLYSLRTASHARLLGWGFIIDGVSIFFVSIGLFTAVVTKREVFLLPWLVVHTVAVITAVPCIVFRAALGHYRSLSTLILKLMYAVMTIYLYVIVLSYFRLLRFNKAGRVLSQPEQTSYMPSSSEAAPSAGFANDTDDKYQYGPQAYKHLPPGSQPVQQLPINPPAYDPTPCNPPYPPHPPPAYSDVV